MVSADGQKSREEANRPQCHNDDPCDDIRPKIRSTKDLEIEE